MINIPKGTKDILPADSYKWQYVEGVARDLAHLFNLKEIRTPVFEHTELFQRGVGETTDVLRFCDKKTAFEAGIRAMRPNIIVTDELSVDDCKAVEYAVFSGIIVFASAHISQFNALQKPFLGLFSRYVFLDLNEIGKISCICNEEGRELL